MADDASRTPYLSVVEGPDKGKQFDLLPSVTTIGRVVGDVLLPSDKEIANQHAWITHEENAWVLYDADSKTGTYVNGEQITREEILPGDLIKIGATILEFRGAGGNTGIFQDKIETPASTEKLKDQAKPKKKKAKNLAWVPVALLSLPAVLIAGALIVLGIILPNRYIGALNQVTEARWQDTFKTLSDSKTGDPLWTDNAQKIVDDWQTKPLGEAQLYYAPAWVLGSKRINNEAEYRFRLFNLAEQFLSGASQVAPGGSPDDIDSTLLASSYSTVNGIEPLLTNLETPSGVSRIWLGRKNQLLGVIREWKAAAAPGANGGVESVIGFTKERDAAVNYLLTGWYTYQGAKGQFNAVNQAFTQFQLCGQTLQPVFDARPGDKSASAVRGLAEYLGAKILYEVGDQQNPTRWDRAKTLLDQAEVDINNTDNAVWSKAITSDLSSEFKSPASVKAQINALRTLLTTSVLPPGPSQPTPQPSSPPPSTPTPPSAPPSDSSGGIISPP
jgi:pSer/pThr/pTyr-binding forkhead associated (FHA) protein